MEEYSYKYYRKLSREVNSFFRHVVSEFDFFTFKKDISELLYWYNGGTIYGYEEFNAVIFRGYRIIHIIRIGKKTTEQLEKLIHDCKPYTADSIFRAFEETRALGFFLAYHKAYHKADNRYYDVKFDSFKRTLSIESFYHKKQASEALAKKNLEILTNLADRLRRDLDDLETPNVSELVRKAKERKNNKGGKLLTHFLVRLGRKIGLSILGGIIGNPLPDDGGDPDVDFDDGYDTTDYDNDSYIVDHDNNTSLFGYSDGVSFEGKQYNGYIDENHKIVVPIMGGDSYETLYVYSKPGSNSIYVTDGFCQPVKATGNDWIKVGSHKFKVRDIKNKI